MRENKRRFNREVGKNFWGYSFFFLLLTSFCFFPSWERGELFYIRGRGWLPDALFSPAWIFKNAIPAAYSRPIRPFLLFFLTNFTNWNKLLRDLMPIFCVWYAHRWMSEWNFVQIVRIIGTICDYVWLYIYIMKLKISIPQSINLCIKCVLNKYK